MEREYIQRSGASKRPPPHKKSKRRRTPPFLLALLLILIISAIVLLIVFVIPKMSSNDDGQGVSSAVSESSFSSFEVNSESSSALASSGPAEEPDITGLDVETLNTMMIVGSSGYRYFTFNEDASISYIETIADARDALGSDVTLYNMIIPTAADIVLPQSFLTDKSTSDQQKALDYLTASINGISPAVKQVQLYDALKAHCDEFIYFKTDRNWTSLGAYYAYRQFTAEKVIEPIALADMKKTDFTGFTGSLYAQSDSRSALNITETIEVYAPDIDTTATIMNSSGEEQEMALITDVSESDAGSKYHAFLGGDYSYMKVVNNQMTDGEACIVIKDSYGGPFIPFLVPHYKTIYIIDYRYWTGDIPALVSSTGASDVIIMNHIEFTSNAADISDLSQMF